jgi:outer membrane cobalamin receptor
MTTSRRASPRAFALAAACAVALRSTLAAADDPQPTAPTTPTSPVAEVEVRGTSPEPSRTPASTAVVTRAMLDSLPGGDSQQLPSVLNTQPGFVQDSFGLLHARTMDGGESYVIDGVPLGVLPLGQFQSFIPLRLVKEIRITTGGFPAEYGVGLGAVIDVTTREAFGPPAGQVQMVYGTYQHVAPSFDYSQQIGKLSLLIGGGFETTNRGLDPPSATPILNDAMQKGTGFARAEYELDKRNRIEVLGGAIATHYQVPIDPNELPLSAAPPGAVRGNDIYGNTPPPFVPYDAHPTEGERDVFVTVAYTRKVGEADVFHFAPYVRESYGLFACDPAGSLGPTADPGSTCADVSRNALHEGSILDYAWTAGEHQRWKAGALIDVAEGRVGYTSYFRDDASPLGGADPSQTIAGSDRTHVLAGGVYLQDTLTFGKWTVLPGVRADFQHTTYPGSGEPPLSLAGPSGRLGASYAVSRDLVVHAFVGSLWQPPVSLDAPVAARILVPALAGQTLPVDLKAETDAITELGVEDRLFGHATVGLTGWGRLSKDLIDRQPVGTTDLYETYNFARGRATGVEVWLKLALHRWLDGFANAGWQLGQGQGTDSERYLFTPAELAYNGWQILDHVQTWTANVAFDLHDESRKSHLSGLFNYGSGMRTGANNDLTVPSHSTLDLTLRHRFDFAPLRPEVAVDVYNVFNEAYALRYGNGVDGSAFGSLRRVDLRMIVPFAL